MRFTSALSSGAPSGTDKVYLGWWGDLGSPKQKGIVTYSLSQNQQKAMSGAFEGYIVHGTKRLLKHAPYWAPPFIGGYIWWDWAVNKYAWYNSKEGHHQTHLAEVAEEKRLAALKAAKQ